MPRATWREFQCLAALVVAISAIWKRPFPDFGGNPLGMRNAPYVGMDRPQLETRSQAFAVRVVSLCGQTRKTPEWRSIADQLLDAATSVAANYRASGRARSRAEFVAKLGVVNEEADETVYWLELMRDGNVGDRHQVGLLLPEATELRAIFAASYATARRNRGKR